MGFRINTNQQISMRDRFINLTDRERGMLEKSWADAFASQIFPLINEEKFKVLYNSENGRPNTPVNVVIGSLLLKEMFGLTDEELVESVIFDLRFQQALRLTSYEEIPYSDRTPSRFRERLYKYEVETGNDLLKDEIESLAEEFTKIMKIQSSVRRTDSLMVSSNCKNMSRLELIYTCTTNLVKALVKLGETEMLSAHLLSYSENDNKNSICYRLDKDEVVTRLEMVTADAITVYHICGDSFTELKEYQLMTRMLGDQTENEQPKPNNTISPQSLQNPSDEDATYRKKAGKGYQGYVANVVEICSKNGNIITQYDYDVNRHSDVEFGAEIIEKLGNQETQNVTIGIMNQETQSVPIGVMNQETQSVPIGVRNQETQNVLISDGAYASEDNFQAAAKYNILFVPTALIGEKPPEILPDFKIENKTVKSCPEGQEPADCRYNDAKEEYYAHFDKATCENCSRREECPVIMQKKRALFKITQTTINRSLYSRSLSTEEYKGYARIRNGVEGVPSVLRRRYNVDDMPVYGLLRSKLWFGFKIGAINVKRVLAAVIIIFVLLISTLSEVFYPFQSRLYTHFCFPSAFPRRKRFA